MTRLHHREPAPFLSLSLTPSLKANIVRFVGVRLSLRPACTLTFSPVLLGPRRLRESSNAPSLPNVFPQPLAAPQIVLEFMRRGSADALLWKPEDAPIELRWDSPLLTMAEDCAAAMCYLHSFTPNPVVHRDLKVVPSPQARILCPVSSVLVQSGNLLVTELFGLKLAVRPSNTRTVAAT